MIRKIKEESQAQFQLRLNDYYNQKYLEYGKFSMLEFDVGVIQEAINKIDTVEIIDFLSNICEGQLKY